MVRADFAIETKETTLQDFSATKESISAQIDFLINKFVYSEDRPPVRKIGLKLTNLIRSQDLQKVKATQKKITDYF